LSQSAGRNPLLLAGIVLAVTVALGLAAWGLNRVTNPPPPITPSKALRACPSAPTGHPAQNPQRNYPSAPPLAIDPAQSYTATICTERGPIVIALRAQDAPQSVNNFVFLANAGFYDGLAFHRVCPNPTDQSCGGSLRVAQGGDPKGDGSGGPGYTIADEAPKGSYTPGTVAFANSNSAQNANPHTTGSQFFIDTGDNSALTAQGLSYNLFGDVSVGLDIAQALQKGDKILWIATSSAPASPAAAPAASAPASPPAPAPSPS
jgi:cyclophilin family peptidyl-prolyl cis-trans isomerase